MCEIYMCDVCVKLVNDRETILHILKRTRRGKCCFGSLISCKTCEVLLVCRGKS